MLTFYTHDGEQVSVPNGASFYFNNLVPNSIIGTVEPRLTSFLFNLQIENINDAFTLLTLCKNYKLRREYFTYVCTYIINSISAETSAVYTIDSGEISSLIINILSMDVIRRAKWKLYFAGLLQLHNVLIKDGDLEYLSAVGHIQHLKLNPMSYFSKYTGALLVHLTTLDIHNTEISDAFLVGMPSLKYLNVENCPEIRQLNSIGCSNLDELYAGGTCGLSNATVSKCSKLRRLDISFNPKINSIQFCESSLEELNAYGNVNFSTNGLGTPKQLWRLIAGSCPKLTDLSNCASTLRVLDITGTCGVGDEGLKDVKNLYYFAVSGNNRVTNILHFNDTLLELVATSSLISDSDLEKMTKLVKLTTNSFTPISRVSPFARTLKVLSIAKGSQITYSELKKLKCLEALDVTDNENIRSVNIFTDTLLELHAGGSSGVDQNGMSNLIKLRTLSVSKNQKITSVNHFSSLEILYARGICGLTYMSIKSLENLTLIDIQDNPNIVFFGKKHRQLKTIRTSEHLAGKILDETSMFSQKELTNLVMPNGSLVCINFPQMGERYSKTEQVQLVHGFNYPDGELACQRLP